MNRQESADWATLIGNAVAYLEEHLADEIDYAKAAQTAAIIFNRRTSDALPATSKAAAKSALTAAAPILNLHPTAAENVLRNILQKKSGRHALSAAFRSF